MSDNDYIGTYLAEAEAIIPQIDKREIQKAVEILQELKKSVGRLFILGVGGSAANASHAVNDFRKIADIEAYTPADNVSELTARVNDDGWDTVFSRWLKVSRLSPKDCVLVLSVGGGNEEKMISMNLVHALRYARETGCRIIGIVGRDGGYTKKAAHACILIPSPGQSTVTPHTEAFQGVIWHLLVSHPAIKANEMKWETLK